MENAVIVALMSISIVAAFGVRHGFNHIFEKNFIDKYKKFKSEIETNLKKRLLYISIRIQSSPDESDKLINDFFKEWQDYQDNIKESYDRMMTYRDAIFIIFLISGFLYFLSLNSVNLLGQSTLIYGNLAFGVGFFAIFAFGKEMIDINKKISQYELSKPLFETSIAKIKRTVIKKKK